MQKQKTNCQLPEMALSSRERGPPSGVQRPLSARTPTSAAGRRSNTHQRRRPSSRCIAVCQAARTATRGICGHTTLLSPRAPPLGKPPPRSSCRRQTARLCLQRGACPFRRRPCSALHLDKAGFEDESTPYRGSPRCPAPHALGHMLGLFLRSLPRSLSSGTTPHAQCAHPLLERQQRLGVGEFEQTR